MTIQRPRPPGRFTPAIHSLARAIQSAVGERAAPNRILFWSALMPPDAFVRDDIAPWKRQRAATLLVAGYDVMAYMGWAECRICGERLGTKDLGGHGLVWPEKAEHYITEHGVWTPDCDRLLAAGGVR